ncbi:hypothetical protein GCM10009682_18590 [Luedemannella flava]|uniref:Uncharacterized protein n=1 Tax=Luedemannella flava TaxID=349316 RepID=A0ABN2LR50_9ACTN
MLDGAKKVRPNVGSQYCVRVSADSPVFLLKVRTVREYAITVEWTVWDTP